MPISRETLEQTLQDAFPGSIVAINDLAGDNDHWSATITCASFTGKSRIEQHRMVQQAVSAHDIHALQIITRTP